MRLNEIGEDRLIKGIHRRFARTHALLIKGIGDDTCVAAQTPGKVNLATTDVLTEGVHFKKDYTTAYLLGKKALAISLSDIAAMGGDPTFFLVSLGLTPSTTGLFLNNIYRGLDAEAKKYGAALAGGNISRSKTVFISLTLFGEMPAGEVLYRKGAAEGDDIYVTGTLGDAALGLKTLKKYGADAIKNGPFKKAVKKHLDPLPRLEAGRALAVKGLASAMIDISDGLMLDLARLAGASKVGALVESAMVPMSNGLKRYAAGAGNDPLKPALAGGEDYELLFTAPPRNMAAIEKVSKKLGLRITRIGGTLRRSRGVKVIDDKGRPVKTSRAGFTHF